MITEDYVSLEIAKLLKEKGFDIPLNYLYNSYGKKCYATSYNWNQTLGDFQDYSCPTLQMAMKWLRETHSLHITIKIYTAPNGIVYAYEIDKLGHTASFLKEKSGFENNENACEAAIKYSLENLI